MSSTIEVRKISIVDLDTDAIVNAANEALAAGGGVCGAIFAAAGYRELQRACDAYGHCDTGDAVITPGFKLKAKYVIHAVGPVWRGGNHGERGKLKSAYKRALELAIANGCRSVGFPLISAGIYGYPVLRAWEDAFDACGEFLSGLKGCGLKVVFAVLTDENVSTGRKKLIESRAHIFAAAEKGDWKTLGMPEQFSKFILHREFSPEQMDVLRMGHIPQEMEDKWFWYMEGDTLYAHRSWTGCCIYRVGFRADNEHMVTVNRDPEQYGCTDNAEDLDNLNRLLDFWVQPSYDYYGEWLSETSDMISRSQKN